MVPVIWSMKVPYNVGVASEEAVLASLEDADALRKNVALIVKERERMAEALAALGWLRPYPSRFNRRKTTRTAVTRDTTIINAWMVK